MDLQSLVSHLRKKFTFNHKTDIEKYILSKNPKTAADVEHWLQQYTYQNNRDWLPNA